MSISFEGRVTEIQSASRFKNNVRRAVITIKDATGFTREFTVEDKEDDFHLDRYMVVTIESYSDHYERTKLASVAKIDPIAESIEINLDKLRESKVQQVPNEDND